MDKIFDKLTSLSSFYKTLYKLAFLISGLRKLYIIVFFLFLFFQLFEISLLAFLCPYKAFMDPSYYSGNFFFDFFLNFFNVDSNNQLILYFSFFFILTCIIWDFLDYFFII